MICIIRGLGTGGKISFFQWRQTLIFNGGALSTFLKISTFSQIIGGAKSILIL